MKVKKTKINIVVGGIRWETVDAQIYSKKFLGMEVAIHKPFGYSKGWVVSDVLTGYKLGYGENRRIALAKAFRLLRKNKSVYHERQRETILNTFRKNREIYKLNMDKARVEGEITLDGILDFAKIAVITTADFK